MAGCLPAPRAGSPAFEVFAMSGQPAEGVAPAAPEARSLEEAAESPVESLSGSFAWPTLALFAGILAGLGTVSFLALDGHLSYWLAMPLNALLAYLIFTPVHEAIHRNISGRHARLRWIDLLIGQLGGFVLLAPYPGFAALHLRHHLHTNHPVEDPDYWVKGTNLFDAVLRCLSIHAGYLLHLHRLATDKAGKRVFAEELAVIVLFLAVVAAAYGAGFGTQLMLLWVLPAYIGLALCPLLFDWVVHHPHTAQGRYTNAAILLFPHPLQRLLDVLHCGQTYHLIHHLYPRVPFYAYRPVYRAIEHKLPALGAKIRRFVPA
jgi:fatty acid desaturase